jgi:hypothetical protein
MAMLLKQRSGFDRGQGSERYRDSNAAIAEVVAREGRS